MKRRVDGYMLYGCNSCKQGFRMYLETGLEVVGDGEKHKPVPFTIKCPFCGALDCHDIAFHWFDLEQKMNPKQLPFFANHRGQDCGTPVNMEFAKPEFRKRKGGAN